MDKGVFFKWSHCAVLITPVLNTLDVLIIFENIYLFNFTT